jgi:CAAX protease family protein
LADASGKHDEVPTTNGVRHSSFVIRHSHLLSRHPWLTFLLPFAVYMVVGSFEPAAPKHLKPAPNGQPRHVISNNWFGLEYKHYPIVYTAKIVLTIAAMIFVLPGYRQFPFRISPLAIIVGLVGVVLWVEIWKLGLEQRLVEHLGQDSKIIGWLGLGERPAYNPLKQLAATPAWAHTFLAVRFLGLALIVPIIEEFFLRGFLMRFVTAERWWAVPFGNVTTSAVILGTLVPVLSHPEKLAALVWFSLVTWLMVRTRNIWDCVAAHAVTNLLLGIYVIAQHQWQLW